MRQKKCLVGVLGLGMVLGMCLCAQAATVVTFDDVTPPGSVVNVAAIPYQYSGLCWENMQVARRDWSYVYGSGHEKGAVSGRYAAFNDSGRVATVSGPAFDFNGAYLTAAWKDGLSIRVEGLLNGLPRFERTVVVNTTGPAWFDFNYRGIDQLCFTSFVGTPSTPNPNMVFVMDNFTYSEPVVPVPAASGLVLLGMGCIAVRRRFCRV